MIIGIIAFLVILGFILLSIGDAKDIISILVIGILSVLAAFIIFLFGCFHGFINHPVTEGTHQGVITAVDLEGTYFRRYEVYLKSSGYTGQSDETKYLLYDYENELAEELKNAIGKTVKINYGHDGGYIGWNSCGTYHIKSIEIIEN